MAFESIDASVDPRAREDLKRFGALRVPIVARGEQWIDGQSLEDVARIAGISWTRRVLPPDVLARQIALILSVARGLVRQLPEEKFAEHLPQFKTVKRSYGGLAMHIGQIVECFLNLVQYGKRLEFEHLDAPIPVNMRSGADLVVFLGQVAERFDAWWTERGRGADFNVKADVYYAEQTLHDFLERTAWHAGQHTRQIEAALIGLGIEPERRLTAEALRGLPVPDRIFDS